MKCIAIDKERIIGNHFQLRISSRILLKYKDEKCLNVARACILINSRTVFPDNVREGVSHGRLYAKGCTPARFQALGSQEDTTTRRIAVSPRGCIIC